VTGNWRKIHTEEFQELRSSLDWFREIKSLTINWIEKNKSIFGEG
jgi:hypothetical protein